MTIYDTGIIWTKRRKLRIIVQAPSLTAVEAIEEIKKLWITYEIYNLINKLKKIKNGNTKKI